MWVVSPWEKLLLVFSVSNPTMWSKITEGIPPNQELWPMQRANAAPLPSRSHWVHNGANAQAWLLIEVCLHQILEGSLSYQTLKNDWHNSFSLTPPRRSLFSLVTASLSSISHTAPSPLPECTLWPVQQSQQVLSVVSWHHSPVSFQRESAFYSSIYRSLLCLGLKESHPYPLVLLWVWLI